MAGMIMISCSTEIKEEIVVTETESSTTQLSVTNSTEDSVLVFLTLSGYPANDTLHVKSVNNIFGIQDSGLVGSFYLQAGDTVSYTSTKWFSGNLGFGTQPINCTVTTWPTGTNPFEFNLNNNQESVDISAIGGVNCLLSVNLIGGPAWAATPTHPDVRFFYNDSMWQNSDLIGVYPYGCTNCTNTQGKDSCQTPNEKPNALPICNPTRAAYAHGGTVLVNFKGYTNTQICK